jgi:hypothetical protein
MDSMNNDTTQHKLVDENAAAALLDCRTQTLRNWRSQEPARGPAYHKIGRNVRYSLADLQEFLRACRVQR